MGARVAACYSSLTSARRCNPLAPATHPLFTVAPNFRNRDDLTSFPTRQSLKIGIPYTRGRKGRCHAQRVWGSGFGRGFEVDRGSFGVCSGSVFEPYVQADKQTKEMMNKRTEVIFLKLRYKVKLVVEPT